MSYGEIPDLVFTTDGDGNVIYSNANTSTGGYSSGNGSSDSGSGYSNPTGKKWWEAALGVLPALFSSIFGTSQTQPGSVYQYQPQSGSSSGIFGTSSILIIGIAAVAVILLMRKK